MATNFSCAKNNTISSNPLIYLVGETHGEPEIMKRELELWQHYYSEEKFRHLFMEIGYVQELILNEWMKASSDELFDRMFEDLSGTAFHTQEQIQFFKDIKQNCPETIFHGTDIGHQFASTGVWYLERMKKSDDSEKCKLLTENNFQAEKYYETQSDAYRENCMTENFIRAYRLLSEGTKIMGIYGSAHTELNAKSIDKKTDCMAKQLNKHFTKIFGECIISSLNLSDIKSFREPQTVTFLEINGKEYKTSYFGTANLKGYVEGYDSRDFYRIENHKEDFQNCRTTSDYLPYSNYPTAVLDGDIYLIVYKKTDGSTEKRFYRADGKKKKT